MRLTVCLELAPNNIFEYSFHTMRTVRSFPMFSKSSDSVSGKFTEKVRFHIDLFGSDTLIDWPALTQLKRCTVHEAKTKLEAT